MEQYLDFEQPIYTCLEKVEELKKAVPAPKNLSKEIKSCLLYTSPSPRDSCASRMPSSA